MAVQKKAAWLLSGLSALVYEVKEAPLTQQHTTHCCSNNSNRVIRHLGKYKYWMRLGIGTYPILKDWIGIRAKMNLGTSLIIGRNYSCLAQPLWLSQQHHSPPPWAVDPHSDHANADEWQKLWKADVRADHTEWDYRWECISQIPAHFLFTSQRSVWERDPSCN